MFSVRRYPSSNKDMGTNLEGSLQDIGFKDTEVGFEGLGILDIDGQPRRKEGMKSIKSDKSDCHREYGTPESVEGGGMMNYPEKG